MIVKYEPQDLSPRLHERQKEIVEASLSKPLAHALKDHEIKEQIRSYLKVVVSKAKIGGGFKVEDWTDHEATTFLNDALRVMSGYGGLGVNEIEIIFFKGMIGDYGQNFGLNLEALNRWFKKYCEQDRVKAIKEQVRYKEEQEKIKDQERLERMRKESYARSAKAIEELKGKGDPGENLLMHPIYYDYLDTTGQLKVSDKEKKEVYDKHYEALGKSKEKEIRQGIIKITGFRKKKAIVMAKDELFRKYIN